MSQQTAEAVEENPEQLQLKSMAKSKIVCRICQGDHFTAKCPYKESLGGLTGGGTRAVCRPRALTHLHRRARGGRRPAGE